MLNRCSILRSPTFTVIKEIKICYEKKEPDSTVEITGRDVILLGQTLQSFTRELVTVICHKSVLSKGKTALASIHDDQSSLTRLPYALSMTNVQ
jgi:hypothetical protein